MEKLIKYLCVPGRNRTCGLLDRNQTLYPLSYGDGRSLGEYTFFSGYCTIGNAYRIRAFGFYGSYFPPMDVSIIIVNYRSREKTRGCLRSVQGSNLSGIKSEIIVVDNSEESDFDESFRREFPTVSFISGGGNVGMGRGNNKGALKATGSFFLILNPDTIVRRDAIRNLFYSLRDREDIGIIGPRLLNPDGTLQYSCLRFPNVWTPIFRRTFLGRFAANHLGRYLMIDFDHQSARDVDWMIGSCLMIRADFYRSSGGFDERFFMYFEDIDLCRRAWRAGFRVVYYPEAEVVHDHTRGSARARWFVAPFTSRLAREHIISWMRYFWKWRFQSF